VKHHSPRQATALAAFLVGCIGWLGLLYLIENVVPQVGARWLFFVLLYMGVAGTATPIAQVINQRLRGKRPAPPDWVSLRQGLWLGLYVTTCAWLQIPRVLNVTIAILLALSFLVLEGFLRLRERAQHGY